MGSRLIPPSVRSRASRGNTETSADFGCLNITFLVSFVPSSSYDWSISKHPILKPDGARCTERCYETSQLAPGESRKILLYISSGSSRTRFVYFSHIIRKMRRDSENNAGRKKRRRLPRTCSNLIPFCTRKNIPQFKILNLKTR